MSAKSNPPRSCNSSIESFWSIQSKETYLVRDTSDTESYSSEDSNNESLGLKYDKTIIKNSTCQNFGIIPVEKPGVTASNHIDLTVFDSTTLRESHSINFLSCALCKRRNSNPLNTYCEKCFIIEKYFQSMSSRKRKYSFNNDSSSLFQKGHRTHEDYKSSNKQRETRSNLDQKYVKQNSKCVKEHYIPQSDLINKGRRNLWFKRDCADAVTHKQAGHRDWIKGRVLGATDVEPMKGAPTWLPSR
ncbi:hypothetical protein ACJJTC_005243 [Scirpophaga incertulas]